MTHIEPYRELILAEKYDEADANIREHSKTLSPAVKREIMSLLTWEILIPRGLEWTNHNVRRTFRFYSLKEKRKYLARSNDMLAAIRKHTPNACYGFGAVLGMARHGDFVPHDDDLDILLGFSFDEAKSFADAKAIARQILEPEGFTLHGDYLSHFNVTGQNAGAAIDLFLGFIEGERVSWFPSRRKGLHVSDVFPSRRRSLLGVPCEFPASPGNYLAGTYGDDWRRPMSNWMHPWKSSEFADLLQS